MPAFRPAALKGLVLYGISSLLVIACAVWVSRACDVPVGVQPTRTTLDRLRGADASFYERIFVDGYQYRAQHGGLVAHWPLYPLLGLVVFRMGVSPPLAALVVVSNLALIAAFALFARYLNARWRAANDRALCDPLWVSDPGFTKSAADWSLVILSLAPFGLFFRFACSESVQLATLLLVFFGFARRWNLWLLALLTGLATAARPVGIALVPAFSWHAHSRLRRADDASIPRHSHFTTLATMTLVALWGVTGFTAYVWYRFGDPLAAAKAQMMVATRPVGTLGEKLVSLASLEPIWSVYIPGDVTYWDQSRFGAMPFWCNCQFLNPIFFVGTAALVVYGTVRNWLTVEEWLLGAGLLIIPYLTRSYEMGMNSHGRFSVLAFPAFIVLGRMMACWPRPLAVALAIASGGLLLACATMSGAFGAYV